MLIFTVVVINFLTIHGTVLTDNFACTSFGYVVFAGVNLHRRRCKTWSRGRSAASAATRLRDALSGIRSSQASSDAPDLPPNFLPQSNFVVTLFSRSTRSAAF